jgi:6-phosphogluconolactonase (cycloisomerase 2 family)
MKFKKFGKALLTGALSAGVIFGASSCIQSYTVGYLYVTGTVTATPNGNGIISGFKIDHNTGQLRTINTLPVSSAGANPVRALLTSGSRFLYVLNRGTNAAGNGDCTTANPCQGSNITQFAVGGNGVLTFQQTFYTQGINPFRLALDPTGNFLLVLDHDAPSSTACQAALGTSVTSCGDVTVFQIDQTTGRLSLVVNAQVTAAGGASLTYFPVPANPVDFLLSGGFLLTLSSGSPQTSFPYTGGSQVFPYGYSSTSGQLTLSQNTVQQLGIHEGNAIVNAASVIYVLDNEPISFTLNGNTTTAPSQILPFNLGSNGALQAQTGGVVPGDPTLSNPIYLIVESKGKFVYVANQGSNITGPNPQSGISGYFLTNSPSFQLTFIAGQPFGSGSGPQCLVEDPSDQFIYTANQFDSSITGRVVDPNSGVLNPMRVASTYSLQGPASWCLMDGRTN